MMLHPHHKNIGRLYSFMLTVNINRFEVISITDTRINAKVGWPDDGSPNYDPEDETQHISWDFRAAATQTDAALDLLMILSEAGHIDNDKIVLSKDQIAQLPEVTALKLNTPDRALETLLSISVDMVDDGQRTDSFFIHI